MKKVASHVAPLVVTESIGPVRLIGINRPDKRNAVNKQTSVELIKAIRQMNSDADIKSGVLYGKGGTFCAGYDLSELSNHSKDMQLNWDLSEGVGPMGPSKMISDKPLIAAIDGYAVAGGMELALMCDLRVMENTAVMGVFCRRFGVPLIDGGTVRLPYLIGFSRALDLLLTGREIRAKEALEFGLVNRVCDTGTAIGRAMLLAQEVSKFPQECLKADKRSAYNAVFNSKSFKDALKFEMENGKRILREESIEGAKQFMSGIGRHGSFNLHKLNSKG